MQDRAAPNHAEGATRGRDRIAEAAAVVRKCCAAPKYGARAGPAPRQDADSPTGAKGDRAPEQSSARIAEDAQLAH